MHGSVPFGANRRTDANLHSTIGSQTGPRIRPPAGIFLDEKDRDIVELVISFGWLSRFQIADYFGIPAVTIHRRAHKLAALGLLDDRSRGVSSEIFYTPTKQGLNPHCLRVPPTSTAGEHALWVLRFLNRRVCEGIPAGGGGRAGTCCASSPGRRRTPLLPSPVER